MITISTILFDQMVAHAQADAPHECCGGLLGTVDNGRKIVTQVVPIQNNWVDSNTENKTRRFRITATDYRQLESTAKQQRILLLGFYHSHPDHPPIPSQTDYQYAWPFFSYPILSLKDGVFDAVRSYTLLDERLVEEPLTK